MDSVKEPRLLLGGGGGGVIRGFIQMLLNVLLIHVHLGLRHLFVLRESHNGHAFTMPLLAYRATNFIRQSRTHAQFSPHTIERRDWGD